MTYDAFQIARELDQTALGDTHHGNALRVAKDFPCLDAVERAVLDRWATGRQAPNEHLALQDIANKIRRTGLGRDKTMVSYLIVPAHEGFGLLGDTGGQCRIVKRLHHAALRPSLTDYRINPDAWTEAGLMNSQGKLVCLEAPAATFNDLKACEPLSAPGVFRYDSEGNPV